MNTSSIIPFLYCLLSASLISIHTQATIPGNSISNPQNDITAIHNGANGLPQKYDGTGVTVGILDMGLDPNHAAFSVSGSPTESRVKAFYLWQNSEFTLQNISGFTTDTQDSYHGTHVAGIAAGGYNGEGRYNDGTGVKNYQNLPAFGIASNADIVMAAGGGNLSSQQIKAGLARLFEEYNMNPDRPMVINLSSGDIKGSHSGSGDGVTGSALADYAGKGPIICVAAGNE